MSVPVIVVLCYACALLANLNASPAPPRRLQTEEYKMAKENTIIVKRMPNPHLFPFSLIPVPRAAKDYGAPYEDFPYRSIQHIHKRRIER